MNNTDSDNNGVRFDSAIGFITVAAVLAFGFDGISVPTTENNDASKSCYIYSENADDSYPDLEATFIYIFDGKEQGERLNENKSCLSEIAALKDNWNGNGASSFQRQLLQTASGLIDTLAHQPDIFPTARDSIQFEYETPEGDYLEFELFENDTLKMFFCGISGKMIKKQIALSDMNKVVNQFYGKRIE